MYINSHMMFKNSLRVCKSSGQSAFITFAPNMTQIRGINFSQKCIMHYKNRYNSQRRDSCILRTRINLKLPEFNVLVFRSIRTSEPRNVPPILWVVFNPILKLTAILTGRTFRKWWKDLPPNKKKYFVDQIKANRKKIAVWLSLSILLSLGYYVSHLEETPITKRIRFMAFSPKQMEEINAFELEHILQRLSPQILPPDHPYTRRVLTLVNRIVAANSDIKEIAGKKFGVAVIDSSIENAFVLPIGHVFVFSGMMKLCSNDDQLGNIIAHEIAHCIQNHGAENVSFTQLLDFISVAIITVIWAIFPSDAISILTQWLYHKSIQVLLELPYSRKIENEADEVGLQLAAKACFDVRESSAFWTKMAFFKRTQGNDPEIEFLSTHPSNESRSEHLDNIMDKAIKLRENCGCPRLSYRDPRQNVEAVSKALEITRRLYYEKNAKPVFKLR